MLDDIKVIHERDADDALGINEKQAAQLTTHFELSGNHEFGEITQVVYAGMGGSALAALFVQTWPKLHVPYEIVRDYNLPAYVGPNTLVICASYSGNTEETLSALHDAEQRGAQIAVIAGGGVLRERAQVAGHLLGDLPKVVQPRYAVLYNYRLILDILVTTHVVEAAILDELVTASQFLNNAIGDWLPTVPTSKNPAKQLALEAIGKSVVMYGGPVMAPAVYKWKIGFNENAKQVAWYGLYPEFNHNEFMGWTKNPVDKPYCVIDLRSNLEHPRVQRRFIVSEQLLSGMRPSPEVVEVQGSTVLEQLLWALAFGDFVTIYTGIANGVNPAPVSYIENFKKELGPAPEL